MIRDNANLRLYGNNHEALEMWRVTQPEIDTSAEDILQTFDNTRVTLANLEGIEIWERVYGILPNPADDLEVRRARVLARMRMRPPFTETWLKQLYLPSIFPNAAIEPEAHVDYINLHLYLRLPSENRLHIRWVLAELRSVVPANIMMFAMRILGEDYIYPAKATHATKVVYAPHHYAEPVDMDPNIKTRNKLTYVTKVVYAAHHYATPLDPPIFESFAERAGV